MSGYIQKKNESGKLTGEQSSREEFLNLGIVWDFQKIRVQFIGEITGESQVEGISSVKNGISTVLRLVAFNY